ncbi:MAG TPA: hypothetical protein RMH99_16990 [Sandaracinaceae bacterium LLY-WYZ-13_1]|nr:hypothetical protein [Sandaracinaceae bacterium LLY-WYZ-13_1]
MRSDAHISITRTEVRRGQLTRHAAERLDAGRAFVTTTGLGLPRTWGLSTRAVLDGFERGLERARTAPGDQRLEAAVSEARAELAARCDTLVERTLPDATLVALVLAEGKLHVMSVGPGRVYLQRAERPERLTAREEDEAGLLRARPAICSTPVGPGDLILAGSVTAFSTSSIAKAMSVLSADGGTSPSTLATLLTEPAGRAGVGAAAIVLRVR